MEENESANDEYRILATEAYLNFIQLFALLINFQSTNNLNFNQISGLIIKCLANYLIIGRLEESELDELINMIKHEYYRLSVNEKR